MGYSCSPVLKRPSQALSQKEVPMAFSFTNKKGVTYFLHARSTKTKTGKTQTLYFFCERKEGRRSGGGPRRVQSIRDGQWSAGAEESLILE